MTGVTLVEWAEMIDRLELLRKTAWSIREQLDPVVIDQLDAALARAWAHYAPACEQVLEFEVLMQTPSHTGDHR